MSGPATRMHTACKFAADHVTVRWGEGPDHGAIRTGCTAAVRDITPEQLAVMDVATEAMAWESERGRIEASITSPNQAAVVEVNSQLLWLVPENEKALLGELLRRAVQRRKEGGA